MKIQIDNKVVVLVICLVLPVYSLADSSPDSEATSSDKDAVVHKDIKHPEIDRLEQAIEKGRAEKKAIKDRNEELNSRMKELESRILELRETLFQKEEREKKDIRER